MRLSGLLLCIVVLTGCGPALPTLNPAQDERDQKHCNSSEECASGLCSNGRCR